MSRTRNDQPERLDSLDHWRWARQFGPETDADDNGRSGGGDSPRDTDCCRGGDCADGRDLRVDGDHACLAVVEITQDCNLSCSYCFAGSGPGGRELSFAEVVDLLDTVRNEAGTRPIQFSGGEPTVHDELPELVEHAREMGFEHVEVNTNGITLANREGYADAADVDRLDNCCISVPTPDGDLVPFCAYNMTTEDGQYALRNRHGWGGREGVGASESSTTDTVSGVETANPRSGED